MNKYGSAPVFVDERIQNDWNQLPECHKKYIRRHLDRVCRELESSNAIDTIALTLIDVCNRLDKLEKKIRVKPSDGMEKSKRRTAKD